MLVEHGTLCLLPAPPVLPCKKPCPRGRREHSGIGMNRVPKRHEKAPGMLSCRGLHSTESSGRPLKGKPQAVTVYSIQVDSVSVTPTVCASSVSCQLKRRQARGPTREARAYQGVGLRRGHEERTQGNTAERRIQAASRLSATGYRDKRGAAINLAAAATRGCDSVRRPWRRRGHHRRHRQGCHE